MRIWSLVFLLACGESHVADASVDAPSRDSTLGDSTLGDSTLGDSTLDVADAWFDEAPALPPLIATSRSESRLEIFGLNLDGSRIALYEAEIGEQALGGISPSPDGRFLMVVVHRYRSFDPVEFERLAFIVDLVARDTTAEPMAAIERLDEAACHRAVNHERSFVWRRDSGAVYVMCSRTEIIEGVHTTVEASTFEVTVDDSARALGGGAHDSCVSLAMPTEADPLLIHGCTDGEYRLGDASFPIGDRIVHAWWDERALTSVLEIEERTFRHRDLAWLGFDAAGSVERQPVDDALPLGSMIMAISPRGDVPIGYRPPDTAAVESVRIVTREGSTIDTDLPSCTQTHGVPEHVRWAPDASAFTASCREGSFIVRRHGAVVALRGLGPHFVEPVADLRWSADSRHVLRADFLGSLEYRFVVHDADTGEVVTTLGVDPTARVRWRVGEKTPPCGPLTVCGW